MGNPNPSPSTRFSRANQPPDTVKRGPKPGSKNRATVKKLVDAELEKMLGDAHKNIAKSLKKGDIRTSMWIVDTVAKRASDRVDPELLQPLVQAVETFDDISTVSKHALLLAIQGDMTFDQLKAVQDALARHSVLQGVVEIADLRRELRELEKDQQVNDLGTGHIPTWGRLKDVTPPEDRAE